MAEQTLDAKGWPIVAGARVHVRERPGLDGVGLVAGFGGMVLEATADQVEIEEYLTFARRTVRPEHCVVQRGESKASLEHQAIKRGGGAYLRQRARRMQEREAFHARKAGQDEGDL